MNRRKTIGGRRQALERFVMEDFGRFIGQGYTVGSGNVNGDGDHKPLFKDINNDFELGFEFKDKNVKSHTVSGPDWKKAKAQINNIPVFVTRNAEKEIMVHLDYDDFKDIIYALYEKLGIIEG